MAIDSTTTLTASGTSQVFGSAQPLALTAKVTLADHSPAEGTVAFSVNGAVRARVAVADDVASYTLPSTEPVGVKAVDAQFIPGDGGTVSGSSAPAREVTVVAADSSTRIALSAAGQIYGSARPVTATATVELSSGGLPRGSVQFRLNDTLKATVRVDADGTALYTLGRTETVGSKAVTATFVPTSAVDVRGSTSTPATVTVTRALSTTKITASKKSQVINRSSAARITATVRLNAGTAYGKVVFRVDGKVVKTVAVVAGKAGYRLSTRLPVGRHKITSEFVPIDSTGVRNSTSNAITITVRRR